ncbi:MAG: PilZ domain-containing protein, partial [Methylocystis sp.]|nr:PilZ domain-containing protein [Methylocystis sp.]
MALHGRCYLRRDGEVPCHTFEISPIEVSLFAAAKPALGSTAILYLTALGRFAGAVTRITPVGFDMSLKMSPAKRDRLASQLDWYANRR